MVAASEISAHASAASRFLMASPKLLCACFLGFIALPFILYFAIEFNHHQLEDEGYRNAGIVAEDIGERVGIIETTLKSMITLQNVFADLENSSLIEYAKQISQRRPLRACAP